VIAVDTNILVYAHRSDSEWNDGAHALVASLAASPATWGIPWPCVHEFFSIVTHPRIYDPPSTTDAAIDQLDAWLESPSVALLGEDDLYWPALKDILQTSRTAGPRVHDARIAALCLIHGVRELWTADRDFGRFPSLTTRNPLTAPRR
jgi:toxin-antitoxin system PIN domain toxin